MHLFICRDVQNMQRKQNLFAIDCNIGHSIFCTWPFEYLLTPGTLYLPFLLVIMVQWAVVSRRTSWTGINTVGPCSFLFSSYSMATLRLGWPLFAPSSSHSSAPPLTCHCQYSPSAGQLGSHHHRINEVEQQLQIQLHWSDFVVAKSHEQVQLVYPSILFLYSDTTAGQKTWTTAFCLQSHLSTTMTGCAPR